MSGRNTIAIACELVVITSIAFIASAILVNCGGNPEPAKTNTTAVSVARTPEQIDEDVIMARQIIAKLQSLKKEIDENQLHIDYLEQTFGSQPLQQWTAADRDHYNSHKSAIGEMLSDVRALVEEYNKTVAAIPADRRAAERLAASIDAATYEPKPAPPSG